MSVRRILGIVAATSALLVGGALPAFATATYPPVPPSITVSATRVALTQQVTVTVTGCQPNLAGTVKVIGPGNKVSTNIATPNADSQTVITVTVGFKHLGRNTVSVTCDPNGATITQSVKVLVVPATAIWASPTTVNAGGSTKITATGYGPGSKATLTVTQRGGAQMLGLGLTADVNGAVTATIPFAKAGTYDVKVLGVDLAGAPLSQTITITVLGAALPHTGADIVPWSAGGLALLLAGGMLVVASRRRRATRA